MAKTEEMETNNEPGEASVPLVCYVILSRYQEHGFEPTNEFNGVFATREDAEKAAKPMLKMCYLDYDIEEVKLGQLRT